MGVVIVARHEDGSRLDLAGMLWLLASFGFVHGFREWMDLWRVVRGDSAGLATARPLVLLVSYLLLFEFGRRLTRASLPDGVVRRSLGPWVYAPLLSGVLAGTAVSDHPLVAMDIWSRYLAGFTGAVLTGIGFHLFDRHHILPHVSKRDAFLVHVACRAASVTFFAYAVLGGLVATSASWFPASVVNQDTFLATVHLPVQLFRTICAVLVAISVATLLKVFHLEGMRRLYDEVTERQRAETDLRVSNARLKLVLETTAEGIIGIDDESRVIFANRAATEILAWPSAEAMHGRAIPEVLRHQLSNGRFCTNTDEDCQIRGTLTDGKTRRVADEMFVSNTDIARPVEYVVAPLIVMDVPIGAVVAFHDITERKRNEMALAASNAELEQFAYAASHDLRQPLRMINSYLQLLERHLADRLDDENREFVDFVRDGATRMDQMLVALLEYSRVGRTGEPMEMLDSREALAESLRFLSPAIEDAAAEIVVTGDWPKILVSRNEVVRLFQNLIGNAIKYRKDDQPPRIAVSMEAGQNEWVFAVRDNGIGIDPTQADKLFKVFSRLRARDKHEGTGVGLAICRKIVERHGGRIWMNSEGDNMGCAFYFTLLMSNDRKHSTLEGCG
ncbi:MAG: PAS-domain containing protein, partial [Alphaproteobacteria bacterium]|nr:PAS-domain containing protein [Alphaproteobacteria bacterium]